MIQEQREIQTLSR